MLQLVSVCTWQPPVIQADVMHSIVIIYAITGHCLVHSHQLLGRMMTNGKQMIC